MPRDPQISSRSRGTAAIDVVRRYHKGVDSHRAIEEIFPRGGWVVLRWAGNGKHVGEINGIAPTGMAVCVDATSIHRMQDSKIAEIWEVWDTLGFPQQFRVGPTTG